MNVRALLMPLAALIVAAGLPADADIPTPSEVQRAWQLDLRTHGLPQPIRVKIPGRAETRRFWYLRYTVTNRSGADRMFVPNFVLYTDAGHLMDAGRDVPPGVFAAIKRRHPNALLTAPIDVPGKLLQGQDNARSSVAVWPDLPAGTGGFDIFISGLSGETATVTLPAPVEGTELDPWTGERVAVQRREIVLSKTLQLQYDVLGAGAGREAPRVVADGRRWIMR